MKTYLITYGANNEMATFEADDHHHAIEQFINWQPVSPIDEENRKSIESVSLVLPIEGWDEEEDTAVYAVGNDESWFHSYDLSLVTVPTSIKNADEIEDFIFNNRAENDGC